MAQLSIRTRLILLSGALLLFLLASNSYLNQKLADNVEGMVRAGNRLDLIEEANGAQIAFGEMRYWLTNLAVSMLDPQIAVAARREIQRVGESAPSLEEVAATVRDALLERGAETST